MYQLTANLELLFVNILIVGVLFAFNIRYWKPKILNPLSGIYLLVIAGSIFEMGAFIADGHPKLIWLNYLSNMLYLGSIGFLGLSMIVYASQQFPKPLLEKKWQKILYIVPVAIEMVLLATTAQTGWIFTVDQQGFYHRSSLFVLQMLPYLYLLISTGYGVYWFKKTDTTKERNMYLAISLFAIPPVLLGGLQLLVPANSLDILEISITISLIANYAVAQDGRITRDTLTRLPNREILDVVLKEKMANERRGLKEQLYVLMGDLDGFKSINDTYGHIEGDRALITVADALYAIGRKYKGTATRFGGDEFVLVIEAETEETPKLLIEEINQKLDELSENEKYHLSMSVGYTTYRSMDTIPDILKAADRELYRVKAERKAERKAN